MMIAMIEDCDAIIGKSQGYKGLPIKAFDCDGTPGLKTAWEPTPAEIAALQSGAKIHVTILGTAHPPMLVTVGEIPE